MTEDWAVVVGITAYPGLSRLRGPERDARSFYEWVTCEKGGGIDPDAKWETLQQATLIVSSECKPRPPYKVFTDALPTRDTINKTFENMHRLAKQNLNDGKGRKIGRRLYLYFAGHGFDPEKQVALLTANSSEDIWGNHVSGTGYAEWFYTAGYFEEVILFMDCCRDLRPSISANPVTLPPTTGGTAPKKRFYAYATDLGKKSWERKMADGKVHGVFTTTLMKGLTGAACDRFTGEITALSLRGYLKEAMPFFFDEKDKNNPQILKEPRVPDFGDPDFVIARVDAVPTYPVTVNLSANLQNKDLQLIYGSGENLQIEDLSGTLSALSLTLARGSYTLKIKGQSGPESSKGFDVKGIGPENVIL
jgi:hypothetical protein